MTSRDDTEESWRLAQAIAPLLPAGWRAYRREGWYWAEVRREDGAAIAISVGGHRAEGRVVFRGQPPAYRNGQTHYFDRRHMDLVGDKRVYEITCGAKRKPSDLAREIARRLLPDYDSLWAEHSAQVRRHDAHEADAHAVAERLAGVIGSSVVESKSRSDDAFHIVGRSPDAVSRLKVKPAYDSRLGGQPVRVDFEVHGLDPETAARVLEVIQEAEAAAAEAAAQVRVADGAAVRVADAEDEAEDSDTYVIDESRILAVSK